MPAVNAKNLRELLGLAPAQAQEVEELIRSAWNDRGAVDMILDAVNGLINGFGVEAIRGEYHVDNYYFNIVALYVNMGDTYDTTLLYETDRDRFLITDFGSWVERNQRKYDIQ